jgi:hypothetical protein
MQAVETAGRKDYSQQGGCIAQQKTQVGLVLEFGWTITATRRHRHIVNVNDGILIARFDGNIGMPIYGGRVIKFRNRL